MYELNKPVPYTLHVDDVLLETTKKKLQLARYPKELDDLAEDDWSHGAKVKAVRDVAKYWADGYDWRSEEVCTIAPVSLILSLIDLGSIGTYQC